MPTDTPTILSLDFDGVLCDGLLEYFQTSWRTYCQIWQPDNQTPPPHLELSFCRLRPVIESGWEMPVLLRALILGVSDTNILQNWSAVVQELSESEHLQSAELGKRVDTVRDEWIATDLEGWLKLHRFYPGVIERVQKTLETSTQLFIVTTKEGRFVQQLLQQQGVQLSQDRIIGKEIKRPKPQTLRQLLEESARESITLWFVEDRLQTLLSVEQQTDLKDVRLYLADWGYNTQAHREFATNHSRIQLLSLSQFSRDFADWSV
ncbi:MULTISPECIES: HAD family hydrolase [unclassified Coleofasciculus]|uniref:HAD family hydrolase n=1 Tax=unclassified Coleofasciculus TaxID=2692782 RepID=UPI00187FEA4A|nr:MULTISPECIES: HAD hydrolase-like protein [unclassified Coleofasciculus]MBE9124982.1 HAD hydrolase-like protein [Coleofasciculus sp. LEGE 07081]MBE9148006.1 HAD hydrolase-like protein [Coleofasciculus sp. LEGE 07092]